MHGLQASFAHVGSSAEGACDSFPTPHRYNRRFARAGRIWESPPGGAGLEQPQDWNKRCGVGLKRNDTWPGLPVYLCIHN